MLQFCLLAGSIALHLEIADPQILWYCKPAEVASTACLLAVPGRQAFGQDMANEVWGLAASGAGQVDHFDCSMPLHRAAAEG